MSPDIPTRSTARVCPNCRTGFTTENPSTRQIYCSRTCRDQAAELKPPVARTCNRCGGQFDAPRTKRRLYCSTECRQAAREDTAAMEERVCLTCHSTFRTGASVRQVYCTAECRRDAERQRDHTREQDRARRLGEPGPTNRPRAEAPRTTPPRQQPLTRDPLEPAATRDCPHCHQPITGHP